MTAPQQSAPVGATWPVRPVHRDDRDWIRATLEQGWGSTVVARLGGTVEAMDLPGFIAHDGTERVGLLMYAQRADGIEVVTIQATTERLGIGRSLLEAAIEHTRAGRESRLWLVTTNDNLRALELYQRSGMSVTQFIRDGVRRSRSVKSTIPHYGAGGIAMEHELVLELRTRAASTTATTYGSAADLINSEATIRTYGTADVDRVVALSLDAWAPVFTSFRQMLGDELYRRVHPDWIRDQTKSVRDALDQHETWVAVVDESVTGFVNVSFDIAQRAGEIYMIAVDPQFQRRGIASTLTERALDEMRARDIDLAIVATGGDPGHAPARRTYERAGFTPSPQVWYSRLLH